VTTLEAAAIERLRSSYLEATEPGSPPIRFNHVMIATFCLTVLDISHRSRATASAH